MGEKCKNCGYDGFENCGTHCSACGTPFPAWAAEEAQIEAAKKELEDLCHNTDSK